MEGFSPVLLGDVTWQFTALAAPVWVAAVLASGIAVVAWQMRARSGGWSLTVLMVAVAVWSALYGLELTTTSFQSKLLFSRLSYPFVSLVPVAFLAFAFEYTGRERYLTSRSLALLTVVPAVSSVLVWFDPQLGAVWTDVRQSQVVVAGSLEPSHGPWFFVHTAYLYSLIALGLVVLGRRFLVARHLYRYQTGTILVGAFVPWVVNGLSLLHLTPGGVDLTPAAFVVTGVAFAGGLARYRLLDVVPLAREIARDEVIENMGDGVVVLDDRNVVVDINPTAAAALGITPEEGVGRPIKSLSPALEGVVRESTETNRFRLDHGDTERWYDVRLSPLYRGRGFITGTLISLRNMTERRRHEQRLTVLNRVLRHDLRNDANVIMGYAELLMDGEGPSPYASVIHDRSTEIAELSNKIGDIERALDGEFSGTLPIEIVAVVSEQVTDIESSVDGVQVTTEFPDSAWVSAIPLVEVATENVIENAVEHNDRANPALAVDIIDDPDEVTVVVEDNGPGIPDAELAVIERGTETQLDHASGIGLWLVDWVVRESGGSLSMETLDPRGTRVAIRLPRTTPPESDD